jgi:exoribonuclease R
MNNQIYEENYTKIVEPKYGNKRDSAKDEILTNNIMIPHDYSIKKTERVDMTSYETYSIDPIGCKDADDAFSVYTENNRLYFAIHIADPTEYIDLSSNLWKDIVSRTTTKYPSNRAPIHMMPDKVLELSSLQGTIEGTTKNAITVLSEINSTTYEPIHEIKLLFTRVFVKKENAYSYNDAALICNDLKAFSIGLKISERLQTRRSLKTKGIKLNEVSTAYPIYEDNHVYLYEDTKQERLMKQMIAEFAIFANSFVGEYLKINLNTGIFRTCNASEWLQTVYNEISGEELLKEIITNGIRADYMANIESHDLVGMPEYCHFTSPIRRLSDCVCHYLLKFIYFTPFNISNADFLYSENYIKILLLYKYQMEQLIKENQELKNEVDNLKKELHKYSHSQKEYYENNKNELIKKSNERLKKIAEENPDKIKQYRRNAYLKQKEKKKQKELENKNNEII